MRYTGEPAFVLHTRRWRETSLLVEVLSLSQGRLGLLARGVQSPRRHALRAALQPLQHIRFDAVQRGELATLTGAEAVDRAPALTGDAVLAGFYVNELVLRLAPRQDPHAGLFDLYAEVRGRLAAPGLGWTLRRFERDLLDALGFGLGWDTDGDGAPIDPAARYRLDAEHGARRVFSERDGERGRAATGRALLALAADETPEVDDLPGLRRVLRDVLAHHLGPRGLKSWELMADLGRLAGPVNAPARPPHPATD
ncbi:DNA repair protein RecO [Luteimonas yindakuii]|uniref:DNA repair protein RecO n=1 Tax=Luteimonas yindakuii TaxID=2565782 RepID=A0A4Z1RI73_9GAMM|nr:DNA repair protein RecO [Luteimonas yindakuii]TKS54417.1 DNA repair protein RecO [Luteimonas yindakuii]